jgi:hypothetical protein
MQRASKACVNYIPTTAAVLDLHTPQDALNACLRRASGKVMRNTLPLPIELSSVKRPALASTAPFAIESPSPVPGAALAAVAAR